MNYQLITDSTSDMNVDLIEEIGVYVIPMEYTMDGKTYHNYPDYREQSPHDFYDALRAGSSCSTNQINPDTFQKVFTSYLKEGKDILYLCFSSGLSGTYNTARIVAQDLSEEYPDRKIEVVDTKAACVGEGLLVYLAGLEMKKGKSLEEVRDWVLANRDHLAHWFTVDDLNHLKRGGRISATSALVGTMLSIKPVMNVDTDGHLTVKEKVRGRRQSLDALIRHMQQTAVNPKDQIVFVGHGDSLKDAEYVADKVKSTFGTSRVIINNLGPVIGCHTGAGFVALFFLATTKE